MDYRRFGDTLLVRIDRGEEILEQVKTVALKENIQLASVQALVRSAALPSACTRSTRRSIMPIRSRAALKSSR